MPESSQHEMLRVRDAVKELVESLEQCGALCGGQNSGPMQFQIFILLTTSCKLFQISLHQVFYL